MSAVDLNRIAVNTRRSNTQPKTVRCTDDGFPVRNVYFSFGHNQHRKLTSQQLQEYFGRTGEISSLRLCPSPTHTYGFVQFENPEHAAEVLVRNQHKIAGVYVRVKEADSWHQPRIPYVLIDKKQQPKSPDAANDNDIAIPDLNDDCLRVIFDYVDVLDLISIAKVNSRFESIARERFAAKHKAFDFEILNDEACEKDIVLKAHHLIDFLAQFGPVVGNLTIDFLSIPKMAKRRILQLIVTHCSASVNVLTLKNFVLKGQLQFLQPLFQRLQKLYVSDCVLDNAFVKMLQCCSELTKFKFSSVDFNLQFRFPKFNLPQLKSVRLDNYEGRDDEMKKFLEKNPQLRKISMIDCEEIDATIFPEIARYVPLVEKITFKQTECDSNSPWFVSHAMHLKELRSLKKLKIDCARTTIHSVFSEMGAANVPLEFLQIRHAAASHEFIDSISSLKTLKTLSLLQVSNLLMSHLVDVCENLPELNNLVVGKCTDFSMDGLIKLVRIARKLQEIDLTRTNVQFDNETFKALVDIVRKRNDSNPLKIATKSNSIDVSEELINMNRDKLVLERRTAGYYFSDDEDFDDEYFDEDEDMDMDSDYYYDSGEDLFDDDDDDDDEDLEMYFGGNDFGMEWLIGMAYHLNN